MYSRTCTVGHFDTIKAIKPTIVPRAAADSPFASCSHLGRTCHISASPTGPTEVTDNRCSRASSFAISNTKSTGDRCDMSEGSSGRACKKPSTRPLVKRPWKGGAKPALHDEVGGKGRMEQKVRVPRGSMTCLSGEREERGESQRRRR